MKKVLAIVLMMALMAVLACSAFASAEPPAAPAAAAEAGGTFQFVFKQATATENGWIFEIDEATGNVVNVVYVAPLGGAAGQADGLAAWKAYLIAYAVAGAPNEEEGQTVAGLIDAAASVEEVEAISQLGILFENGIVLGYDAWIAAGMPAAETAGMVSEAEQQGASGEAAASEEPAAAASEEPAAAASEEPAASGEPASDEAASAEAPAAEEAAASAAANPNYDPFAHSWASIEIVMVIVIIVVGAVLMLSFGKKKID